MIIGLHKLHHTMKSPLAASHCVPDNCSSTVEPVSLPNPRFPPLTPNSVTESRCVCVRVTATGVLTSEGSSGALLLVHPSILSPFARWADTLRTTCRKN